LRTEEFHVRRTQFLAEQNGPSEQELKRHLANYFSCVPDVDRAYLVRVAHEKSTDQKVALCLAGGKAKAIEIVQSVSAIFHALFQNSESLDVLFLSDEQKSEVNLIADPFYKADEEEHCRPN